MADPNNVVMEGVRLIFRNFRGEGGPYNQEGARNFGVVLPEDIAEAMAADGWNVKFLEPRDEDEVRTPWLQVKLRYDVGRPPKIHTINDQGKKVPITEATVANLDWAEITNVDLIVRPYPYDIGGRQGIAAYVQTMFVTIEEDALERKYAELESQ